MSRRKQANPAKLDSDDLEDRTFSPEERRYDSSSNTEDIDEEDKLPRYQSDFDDCYDADAGNSSTADASSPNSPGTDDECTKSAPYGCKYCNKAFPRSYLLANHEQTHKEQLQFTCSFCPRLFKHKRSRDRHTKLHTGDKKYKCQHCDSAFSRSDHLKIHMKSHDNRKPFKCGSCSRGYNTAAALASHQLNHFKHEVRCGSRTSSGSSPSPRALPCSNCPETFNKAEQLQNHLNLLDADEAKNSLKVHCMYCGKDFLSVENLNAHIDSCHQDINGKTSENVNIKSEVLTYSCEHCTRQFDTWLGLSEHLNVAHPKPMLSSADFDHYQKYLKDYSQQKRKNEDQTTQEAFKKRKNSETATNSYNTDRPCICSCCNAQLPNFKSFLVHMESHVSLNQSSNTFLGFCPICGEPGRDPIEFGNHIFAHAIASIPGRCCPACNKKFDRVEDLHKHLGDKHIDAVYKCSICNEVLESKTMVQIHLQNKHGNECNHFRCYLCTDQIFHDRFSAELHITMKHSHHITGLNVPGFNHNYKKTFQEDHLHYFHMPYEQNNSQENEKSQPNTAEEQHLNSNTSCDTNTKGEVVSDPKKLPAKGKPSSVSLQCAYCNEFCKSRADLENHMKQHQVNCIRGKYKCNICDEIYSSPLILADHKLRHCKIVSGNICTHCKTILTSELAFYAHQIEHKPGKSTSQVLLPDNCVICCQTLQTEAELQLHAKFHLRCILPNDSFSCKICKHVYDTRTGRLTLMQTVHENMMVSVCKKCSEETGPATPCNKFSCIHCPQKFDTEEEMQSHAAMHVLDECSNLECRLCKQMFSTPQKLQVHLIEHNFYGMNQYSCYVCSSVFTGASGLQNHIITHGLGARPYECSHCHMKFFFRAELDNHRYIHFPTVDPNVNGKTQVCKYCSQSYSETYPGQHLNKCLVRLRFTVKEVACNAEGDDSRKEDESGDVDVENGAEELNELCEIY